MLKTFKDALDAGQIEPANLPNGDLFILDGTQFYQATAGGINMLMGLFHAFSDTLRRHDTPEAGQSVVDDWGCGFAHPAKADTGAGVTGH
jgi:hypothetical protein